MAIVAEHASAQFGGEAALPLHYFRVLRARGIASWLVVHERTRPELQALFPNDVGIHYVADTRMHIALWRLGQWLPARVAYFTTGYVQRALVQRTQKRMVGKLIAQHGINVVHQPMPVSPREPSMLHGFGVPVVIGPMNGNIDFPPAFRAQQGWLAQRLLMLARGTSNLMHRITPGKLQSAVLLVANARTREALPEGSRAKVIELVENGVDLTVWREPDAGHSPADSAVTRFVFIGRLVDWKAVDLLLHAFRSMAGAQPVSLTIAGEGPERPALESWCRAAGLLARAEGEPGKVYFAGWQTQAACAALLERSAALVLPSLMECGGAVVLEAMAVARPVIATRWGGPADYLDETCGILVPPDSREAFTAGLAKAMLDLAASAELRQTLGEAGRRRVIECFDWEVKVDRMLEIYREAMQAHEARCVSSPHPR